MTIDPTHAYRVLGLHPGATLDDVKTAYRDLAQVWHPDRFPENDRLREKAIHNQQVINAAYEVLQRNHSPAAPMPVSVAAPPPPAPIRHLKHSLFTGVTQVEHSSDVLWPSATYARRRRRRRVRPLTWIVLGMLGLLTVAAAALWGTLLLE